MSLKDFYMKTGEIARKNMKKEKCMICNNKLYQENKYFFGFNYKDNININLCQDCFLEIWSLVNKQIKDLKFDIT